MAEEPEPKFFLIFCPERSAACKEAFEGSKRKICAGLGHEAKGMAQCLHVGPTDVRRTVLPLRALARASSLAGRAERLPRAGVVRAPFRRAPACLRQSVVAACLAIAKEAEASETERHQLTG